MVNGENACHSQILNQPFQNKDVEIESRHPCIFSCNTVEKIFFDMLSLENIISDIEPNVSNKQEKIWCKSLQWL